MGGEAARDLVGEPRVDAVAAGQPHREQDRHDPQREFDAGRPVDALERRVGVDPAFQQGEGVPDRRIVAVADSARRHRRQDLQAVDLPDQLDVAAAGIVTVGNVEAVIGIGPAQPGGRVAVPVQRVGDREALSERMIAAGLAVARHDGAPQRPRLAVDQREAVAVDIQRRQRKALGPEGIAIGCAPGYPALRGFLHPMHDLAGAHRAKAVGVPREAFGREPHAHSRGVWVGAGVAAAPRGLRLRS